MSILSLRQRFDAVAKYGTWSAGQTEVHMCEKHRVGKQGAHFIAKKLILLLKVWFRIEKQKLGPSEYLIESCVP